MKRKVRSNSPDREEHNETICAIQQSLQSLDDQYKADLPKIQWFEQMVIGEKERLRKKLIQDISLFGFIAMLILSLVIFSLYKVPIVFFIAQGAVILWCLLFGVIRFVKQVNLNER